MVDTSERTPGRLQIPRSRGAASGLLVMFLGLWGALAPFIGPYFDFAFTPDQPWVWTVARGWLEVLPGAVAALGGLLMFASRNRATALLGSWIAVVAGAWFVIGRALAGPLGLGEVGTPVASTDAKRVWLELTYFYGLGALIIFLAALALGRLSVRTARDIQWAQRSVIAEPTRTDDQRDTESAASASAASATDVNETGESRRRGWRDLFSGSGRHKLAHR
ncbi:hypothetical protein JDV09_18450 [Mycobacterium sp. Y57]|uniref:hypothetical protein n=1 Tax=Mycolicibacterium xanthum TaxID=2796469 RepID=UPI001C85B02E|nr:hypothetical protein [Mycolicibacterium xanthum]MBX7434079.1 hypothetical protein [Mycolicibacterium xanthum]